MSEPTLLFRLRCTDVDVNVLQEVEGWQPHGSPAVQWPATFNVSIGQELIQFIDDERQILANMGSEDQGFYATRAYLLLLCYKKAIATSGPVFVVESSTATNSSAAAAAAAAE